MEKVTIEVSENCCRLARSPLYLIVAFLTGVSVGFGPLFLFWAGEDGRDVFSPYVLTLFAIIYLVQSFYMKFAVLVIAELRSK